MRPTSPLRPRAAGFSLPELLIAVAIGLVILAGLSTLFVQNTRAQTEIEKANRQIENGRYALDLLALDLRNAGYYGEFDPTGLKGPDELPALCAASQQDLDRGVMLPVQGRDGDSADLACLEDVRAATDVLVVRRARNCVAGAAGCADPAGIGPLFQASLCDDMDELHSIDHKNHYRLRPSSAGLDRRQRNCTEGGTTLAVARRYLTHIYFIANNNRPGDGIPTLKRAELGSDGTALDHTIVPLAEGIENMQLEYGLDLLPVATKTGNGVPELLVANPAACSSAPDCAVTRWRSVVAVSINLLARNTQPSIGFTDTKSYVLGRTAANEPHVIAAANDGYKRHVFQSQVNLPNPAGRRTQ